MLTFTVYRLSDEKSLTLYAVDWADAVETMADDYGQDWELDYSLVLWDSNVR